MITILQECAAAISHRRRLIFAIFAVMTLLGIGVSIFQPRLYSATAKILALAQADAPSPIDHARLVATQVEILSSRDLQEDAFDSLVWREKKRDFGYTRLPEEAIIVSAQSGTDIIKITAHARKPEAAAALANGVATTYFDRHQRLFDRERAMLEQRVQAMEIDIAKTNTAIVEFKQKTGLIAPEIQLKQAAEYLATLQSERDAAITQMSAIEQSLKLLSSRLKTEKPSALDSTTFTHDPRFQTLLEGIGKLHDERTGLLKDHAPDSAEVKAQDARIKEQENRLKELANATIVASQTEARNPIYDNLVKEFLLKLAEQAATGARISSLGEALKARQTEAATLPEKERQFTELLQRASLLKSSYESLLQQSQAQQGKDRGESANTAWVARAQPEKTPATPRPLQTIIFFALCGLVAGVALATVTGLAGGRIHSVTTVEQLSGLPVLTMVPTLARTALPADGISDDPAFIESFRFLRHNITFALADRPSKILAVTSPGPGEGKSTVAANLARALVRDGKRVVLVDFDLRLPSVHNILGGKPAEGITDMLEGSCELYEITYSTAIDGLFCIPAGATTANPPELLNNPRTREILQHLAKEFDAVILDCPPSSGISDMQVIAPLADALLLVVSLDQTVKTRLRASLHTLQFTKVPVIGTVINYVDFRMADGYSYSDYGAKREK